MSEGTSCCGAKVVTTTHQPVSWWTCAGCGSFVTMRGVFLAFDTTTNHARHFYPDIGCKACETRPWFRQGDTQCRCGQPVEWIEQRGAWYCRAGHRG
jgi:TPP-dependent indolepyruvate ferredoxin oxidoreductase alpha subunit